ncbi:MAG: hypothetical protein SFH39_14550 [Candidatus Magnetobacterium sp. LHC-1]|nr:hypothetical protein [Nitrospirota bacterium]
MNGCFVGIDVSKDTLDVAIRPSNEHWTVDNTQEGINALIERLKKNEVEKVVLEATGGLQLAVIAAKDAEAQKLNAIMVRHRQIVGMITEEKNRLTMANEVVKKSITEHIEWLKKKLSENDKEMNLLIESSPVWKSKYELLQSVPGVGPVLSATLLLSQCIVVF